MTIQGIWKRHKKLGENMTIDEFIKANNIVIFVEADLQKKVFFIRKMKLNHKQLEGDDLFELFEELILNKNTEELLKSIKGQLMPKIWRRRATYCVLCQPNDRQVIALFYDTNMNEAKNYHYAEELDSQIKELFP